MKLRCTSNSIRIRVRKSDLELLAAQGRVVEKILFPAGTSLEYSIGWQNRSAGLEATFHDHHIEIGIPEGAGRQWMDSEELGLENTLPLEGGGELFVVVEKDFPCKHTGEADLNDTYHELAADRDKC